MIKLILGFHWSILSFDVILLEGLHAVFNKPIGPVVGLSYVLVAKSIATKQYAVYKTVYKSTNYIFLNHQISSN